MYAVIKTGGKQYKVAAGDVIEVERLKIKGDDPTLTLTPLFVVDDNGNAISGAGKLADYKVGVKVVGDTKGDKITVFKYRNKSGYASKTGHRQQYSMIEIISIGGTQAKKADEAEPAKESESADSDSVDK
ncbi:50S ribosomal protein L21 [soil metagenome]